GRVYPSRARRLAPDFFFHDQVYRADGENVLLPPGAYDVTYTRGPEYKIHKRRIEVPEADKHQENFRLARWIKLADLGWYSGDHHVHGAGCAHYEAPTEGVGPEDMMRHILGEDLNVGCVLSWGPCWYFQKQFFEGQVNSLSTPQNLMRYDVEVSGFPSSHAGHLCLLRLNEDDYPGTSRIEEWPSWDLPVLRWGKEQGGIVGFSHSGWGLQVPSQTLPNYDMPPFDGIGANEYIVDVVHDVCHFISAVDTPIIWELGIWYHTLNCGYTARISGETDFPCIYGERVGLGRAYVKLDVPPGQPLDYDHWAEGIRDGRSYCCDGLSHLVDFTVGGLGVGEAGEGGRASVLAVGAGDKPLSVSVRAAAMLGEEPREDIRSLALDRKPYWHVERARVGDTRKVPVELIVNGHSVETREIEADGKLNDVEFEFKPKHSSWVAVRIFPSSHTNPVFVEVDGKPIRASKKSAQWCLEAVDVCWQKKSPQIRETERAEAAEAFEVARQAYRKILEESQED
ncbi:MAG: CehA/McbA family metallohydrolase, partial [Pirellulales bacterium]